MRQPGARRRKAIPGKAIPSSVIPEGRARTRQVSRRLTFLVARQPHDLAPAVAVIAVRRLGEGAGQFPLLRFIAPLNGRVADDVVRLTVGADGGGPCRRCRPPAEAFRRLLIRVERIEKRRMCHVIPTELHEIID